MDKDKVQVRKLMLLSPEYYNQLTTDAPKMSDLMDVEKRFLLILRDRKLTTAQKLAHYNNLFKISFNGKHHSINSSFPNNPAKQEPAKKETRETQTDIQGNGFVYNNKNYTSTGAQTRTELKRNKSVGTDALNESEYGSPQTSFKPTGHSSAATSPIEPRSSNQFFLPNIYEDVPLLQPGEHFQDSIEVNASANNNKLLEDLRSASDNSKAELNDFDLMNLDDSNKSYIVATDRATGSTVTIDKPENLGLSRRQVKRKMQAAKKDKSLDKTVSPFKTRSGAVRVATSTASAAKHLHKRKKDEWDNYEDKM